MTMTMKRRIPHELKASNKRLLQKAPVCATDLSSLLSEKDLALLDGWNGVAPSSAESRSVVELIRQRCDMQPSACAVSAWDVDLSYQELDRLSCALAGVLVRSGIGAGSFVPLYFEKSAYVVVAMLAISKSGGAFVFLDPSQPSQRLLSTLEQLKANICLTSNLQEPRFAELLPGLKTIVVSAEYLNELPTIARDPNASDSKSSDACYVTFTSGSTGEPKGVVIEHGSLAKFCEVSADLMLLRAHPDQSRVLQFASYAFDVCVLEIVATLTAGACVCIPSEEARSGDLTGAINSMRVDRIALTPSVLRILSPEQLPGLGGIATGGEPLTQDLIETWSESVRMVNCYGPCECTIGTFGNPHIDRFTNCASIGHPYGCVGWIVDKQDSDILLPVGSVGELLIEGPLVGREYLNNPEKTAECFIEDPSWIGHFRTRTGNRFYKTGDLVRYAPDGSFIFVGRKDTQVKIRGQRVEISEVELHVRKSHPAIREAVADVIVAADSTPDRATLVVWITHGNGESGPSDLASIVEEMEKAMATRVPKYMIPSLFIPITEIPLSASGKTDRKSLRQRASSKTMAELRSLAPPRPSMSPVLVPTSEEAFMRYLWSKVLGIEPGMIAATDRFIALGGDSIQAIKLSREARLNGRLLPVGDIMKHPQLNDMVGRMSASPSPVDDDAHDDDADGSNKFIPCQDSNKQSRYDDTIQVHLSSQILPNPIIQRVEPANYVQEDAVSQSLLASHGTVLYNPIEMRGLVNIEMLRTACYRLCQRHEVLRTVFVLSGGQLQQVVLKELQPTFDLLYTATADAKSVISSGESRQQFVDICLQDLADGGFGLGKCALKFMLLKHGDDHHTLVIRMCHSNFDGTSMNRLFLDLCADYSGRQCDSSSSFIDYLGAASRTRSQESYTYWKELLQGASMTEFVSRKVPDYILPADCSLNKSIEIAKAPNLGVNATWATVAKAAWAVALSQLCGSRDVVFGHLVSGRNVPMEGVEDVIGPCLGDVPVRVCFDPSWSAADLLGHVQQQYLAGIAHETLPFPEILRHCTNWPLWSRMSSYLHFQNLDIQRELSMGDGELVCRVLDSHEARLDAADVYVMVTPCEGRLDVDMSFNQKLVPKDLISAALDRFCDLIRLFSAPDGIEFPLQPHIQASIEDFRLPVTRAGSIIDDEGDGDLPQEKLKPVQRVLDDAWHRVLPRRSIEARREFGREDDFYDLGGDFPRLTYLSEVLKEQGRTVAVEELVYRPKFAAQVGLLASKWEANKK